MKPEETTLVWRSPIDLAADYYREHSKINFHDDLADYLKNGCVVARPTCFAMAKICWVSPREGMPQARSWFIRFAYGRLDELLTTLPCHLDWIAFCRRGKEKMHVWPLKRLKALAYRKATV